jgi:hypothetical protein
MRPLKRVYSSFSLIAVHHAKNVLQAEGIASIVKNEMLSSAMGELPPAECQAEVWVPEQDAQRAEAVLKEAFTSKGGAAWTCGSCGETCEPQFTQCWKCLRPRPSSGR